MRELSRDSRLLQSLRHAMSGRHLVRIVRAIDGADQITGHVVAVGTEWMLLGVVSEGSPNGWVAFPIVDIAAVNRAPGGLELRRALESQSRWPTEPPANSIELSHGAHGVIRSAASSFPLVTFYAERSNPSRCLIGRPCRWSAGHVDWQEISSDAVWDDEMSTWDLSTITRVDVGGQYENALMRVSELRGGI